MTEFFPDIEIYLMKPDFQQVQDWLTQEFSELQTIASRDGFSHWKISQGDEEMDVFLNDKAEKSFASLWFKQNKTSWPTDLDCARAAHKALGIEIRCSDSGWKEEDGENDDGWIKLIRGEEKPVHW